MRDLLRLQDDLEVDGQLNSAQSSWRNFIQDSSEMQLRFLTRQKKPWDAAMRCERYLPPVAAGRNPTGLGWCCGPGWDAGPYTHWQFSAASPALGMFLDSRIYWSIYWKNMQNSIWKTIQTQALTLESTALFNYSLEDTVWGFSCRPCKKYLINNILLYPVMCWYPVWGDPHLCPESPGVDSRPCTGETLQKING